MHVQLSIYFVVVPVWPTVPQTIFLELHLLKIYFSCSVNRTQHHVTNSTRLYLKKVTSFRRKSTSRPRVGRGLGGRRRKHRGMHVIVNAPLEESDSTQFATSVFSRYAYHVFSASERFCAWRGLIWFGLENMELNARKKKSYVAR